MTLLDLSQWRIQESIQEFERTDEFPEPIESQIDRKTDEKVLKDYSTQISETLEKLIIFSSHPSFLIFITVTGFFVPTSFRTTHFRTT